MGTIYSVACRKCKVVRDLDKFYRSGFMEEATREAALKYCQDIEKDSFRAGLLVSFMSEHIGHDCVFFNEHSDCEEELDPFENKNGFIEDYNFWGQNKDHIIENAAP